MRVLIVIPAYNEEASILKTCQSIIDYNKENNTKYDMIVINDGSVDKTEQILIDNNINRITLIQNLGIGGAVQTGYKYAYEKGYDIAIQFDGDGQHDINYVKDLIKPIEDGKADMVIGSRFIKGAKSKFQSTKMRRVGINILSSVIKSKTGKRIYDTTSGFRAIDRKVLKKFVYYYPLEYPEPISTVTVLTSGLRVKEVPVQMKPRAAGKSSISKLKSAYYMINVVLSIWFMKGNKK